MTTEVAVIAGAGSGLSASLARLLTREGLRVVLAARDIAKLDPLIAETGAEPIATDVSDPASVENLFAAADKLGRLSIAVFNASGRVRGPIAELDPESVRQALMVGAFGGFLVGQQAARRLLARGSGSILFTGASASVKGFANSAGFAMPKFGLRGLAQSMARELAPKNIHVAHFVIDGGIASASRPSSAETPDRWLSPDAIAETYLAIHRQHRSAWTWEVELRPWVESF
ncbi:SDR family NAD(P)-dependent oxidoreductase [Mesorhizobium sp. BAC0120]|uniref:SDR family NAD(P)-dependent oxidoreductase n=1 Tax=Mesorhizobium sp. BAC0120 TaxID=3090670 RepID=UPI00298C92D2|nr:SDR family NAD(P)-dependent oxidoreductase [Mesorhizobium sp. BAC0120]MDW6024377.1 SDR family NAD(P)-dependent oxidoreductase [Mesorhizobium sp. BAC0120]